MKRFGTMAPTMPTTGPHASEAHRAPGMSGDLLYQATGLSLAACSRIRAGAE